MPGTTRFGGRQAVTSRAQDGLWLLDRLAPQTAAYRICRGYDITGPLVVEALRAAWLTVVARHEILRTTLVAVAGRPEQRIAADSAGSFGFVDLSHLSPPARDSHADGLCAGLAADPISLADGPLARLTVVRLSGDLHRAVLVLHRAVCDERSVSILATELSAAYGWAVHSGAVGRLVTDLPAQYADYARWQRELETTAAYRRLRDWWTSALTPLPPALALPVDRERSGRPAGLGGRLKGRPGELSGLLRFDWGRDIADQLAKLSTVEDVSPFAILLAAYQCLLLRHGGAQRVAVGVPVAVRPIGFARNIGPFDNLLVLCGDAAGSPTFREFVGRVSATARDALDHRGLPFDHLVRALRVERDPRRVPLCDAVFAFREAPEADLSLAGTEVRPREVDTGAAATDLTLTVERVEPSVAGTLGFRGDVFEPESARLLLDQLRTLLAAGLAAPGTRVDELPLDDEDRVREAVRAADQLGAAVAAAPVHETVRDHAARTPAAHAVDWAGGALSYGELDKRAARIAGHLRALGVGGSAVAVRLPPGPDQVAASLGVLRAGARLLWFGTGDAGERGRAVLADLRPACLLRAGDPAGDELARWYRDELGGRVVDVAALDHGNTTPVAAAQTAPDAAPSGDPVAPDQVAYVAYTSGSTGRPKGIAQTHAAFAQFVTWMAGALDIRPGSRVAQWVAPEHDPSLCEVFATLVAGGTLCPVPARIRAHPEKLVDWLADERITFLQTVPSFARELLRAITAGGAAGRLASLERLVLMGEALPGELANGLRAALPGVRLANVYGPTETIAATWHEITEPVDGTVPIGRPIPGRQVLILDAADRPCPTGVTGEIVIRSPYVTPGYVGDGAADAFRPVPGYDTSVRCYRTGDLARRRPDGRLEFRGRRDLQVKLSGTRIELADVEAALAEHDSIAECAVVPLTDPDGLVERLVAYVVPLKTSTRADAWRAHLRRRFGASVLLVSFETLRGALPRNVAGKVDRRRLPAPRGRLAHAIRLPRTPVERGLAEIWSRLLGGGRFAADDTFFAAGGHSLLVPQLVDRIRERFGVEIPLWECFVHSTLAGMSALIVSAGARDDTTQRPIPADMRAVTEAMVE